MKNRVLLFGIIISSLFLYSGCKKDPAPEVDPTIFSDETVAAENFESGNGTSTDPYIIASASQLKRLIEDLVGGVLYSSDTYFKLVTDINITTSEWTPIGNGLNYCFVGNFDGNNKKITGTLQNDKRVELGFFGCVVRSKITNVHLSATVINSYISDIFKKTGGIVASSLESDIFHCSFSGEIFSEKTNSIAYIGGVVAEAFKSNFSHCSVSGVIEGDVSGGSHIGGIAATILYGSLNSCVNSATIIGKDVILSYVGGITGESFNSSLHLCRNDGDIFSGESSYIGALAGMNMHPDFSPQILGIYSCCTNSGKVNGVPSANAPLIGDGLPMIACEKH